MPISDAEAGLYNAMYDIFLFTPPASQSLSLLLRLLQKFTLRGTFIACVRLRGLERLRRSVRLYFLHFPQQQTETDQMTASHQLSWL